MKMAVRRTISERGLWIGAGLSVLLAAWGCSGGDEAMHCDDLMPASDAKFSDIESLVFSARKGCAAADCHGQEQAKGGYRFDESFFVYEEFTTRIDYVYPQVASGEMPEDGRRWSEADLRLVRTWYCNGASPND
jgi:hypothetical protein